MRISIFKNSASEVIINLEETKKRATLLLSGALDENSWLRKVNTYLERLDLEIRFLVLDVSSVKSVNSSGIREGLDLISVLQKKYLVSFSRVSEVFLEKAIFQKQMLGPTGTAVAEFEAPYFCPPCNSRVLKLLNNDQFRQKH